MIVGYRWMIDDYRERMNNELPSELRETAVAYGASGSAAVPEPWSHPWHDLLGLRYHQAIAEKIKLQPALLDVALENLRRWANAEPDSTPSLARREWQQLLLSRNVAEIVKIMTDPSEEGHRRRQSTPFAGILTLEESRSIRSEML